MTTSRKKSPASFEDAMQQLQTLVSQLEDGQLPLEKAIESYKIGTELITYCSKQLEKAQEQISQYDGSLKAIDLPQLKDGD